MQAITGAALSRLGVADLLTELLARARVRVPLGLGFAGQVAASAEPLILDRVDPSVVHSRVLLDEGITAMLGVQMISTGRVIGVLHVGSRVPRRSAVEDVELLQLAADRATSAAVAHSASLDRAAA